MITGSCLCGDVAFELDPAGIVMSNNCSCANCRTVSGAGCATFLQVKLAALRWLTDPSNIATFESSPGNHRAFCRRCGSRAPQRGRLPIWAVPGGSLDEDPGVRPQVSFYAGSVPAWCAAEAADQAFDKLPPREFWGPFMATVLG